MNTATTHARNKFKTAYGKHERVSIDSFPETLTQQQFAEECDVNNILKRFEETSFVTHVNNIQGQYGDFSNVEDYQSSVNRVLNANDAFMALSSKLRARFDNDPAALLAFVSDKANRDEAIALGLIEQPTERLSEAPIATPADTRAAIEAEISKKPNKTEKT